MSYRIIAESSIRYPPFESSLMIPERLPSIHDEEVIAEVSHEEEAIECAEKLLPPFRVGRKDEWFVERKIIIEGPDGKQIFKPKLELKIDSEEPPLAVKKQRTGWYLRPNPIHRHARKVVTFAVALFLIGLLFQTIEPVLVALGLLPETIFGGIRFGLLDYPFLVVYVGPLMMVPYFLRLIANVRDLKHQREFLLDPPAQPDIIFLSPVVADSKLHCKINFSEPRDDWLSIKAWWQVGVLPPTREKVMEVLDKGIDSQPPPGFSTPLPHYWEQGLSDGGGFGEETPLMQFDAPGGLFLRPLRMMAWGGRDSLPISGGELELSPPMPHWPGSNHGGLAAIHWEMIIRIDREKQGPLFWVHPVRVAHSSKLSVIEEVHINDGRIEDSIRIEDENHPIAA